MRRVSSVLVLLVSCASLRSASTDTDAGPGSDPVNEAGVPNDPTTDGGGADTGTPKLPTTYDAAQAQLEKLRFPGPLTAQNSKAFCASKRLFWRDGDGKTHGWEGATQTQTDYTFVMPNRPYVFPADTYLTVDNPAFTSLDVYRTDVPGTLKAAIDYGYGFVSADDGTIRIDQRVNNVDLNGTKVRKWNAATGLTEDVSTVLSTKQPAQGWAENKVVLPANVNAPYAVYIVDTVAKTTSSVTFDGGTTVRQYVPTKAGLLISYARTGPVSALRLYKNDDDAQRVEIGDEVANRGPIFEDGPLNEHSLLSRIATYRSWVIYDSAFGIFAYDIASGALTALQLGKDKKVFLTDTMCVLADANLLVYRLNGDATGQIWALPLSALLP